MKLTEDNIFLNLQQTRNIYFEALPHVLNK